jgi:succinyl-CoA synthetase beta subunit
MKIHEYQAKQLMAGPGHPGPPGHGSPPPSRRRWRPSRPLVEELRQPGGGRQVPDPRRGTRQGRFVEHPDVGGVNVVTRWVEGGVAATEASRGSWPEQMLGSTLVTIQTGDEGKQVNRLYIEQGIDIERELYLSILLDRIGQPEHRDGLHRGWVEIEKVAEETPEKILREVIDPAIGLAGFQANRLALGLGLEGDAARTSPSS